MPLRSGKSKSAELKGWILTALVKEIKSLPCWHTGKEAGLTAQQCFPNEGNAEGNNPPSSQAQWWLLGYCSNQPGHSIPAAQRRAVFGGNAALRKSPGPLSAVPVQVCLNWTRLLCGKGQCSGEEEERTYAEFFWSRGVLSLCRGVVTITF